MTRVVSRALQPICTSTALGKDWIPRLSVASFEHMRDDMVQNSGDSIRFPPSLMHGGAIYSGRAHVMTLVTEDSLFPLEGLCSLFL